MKLHEHLLNGFTISRMRSDGQTDTHGDSNGPCFHFFFHYENLKKELRCGIALLGLQSEVCFTPFCLQYHSVVAAVPGRGGGSDGCSSSCRGYDCPVRYLSRAPRFWTGLEQKAGR